MKLENDRSEESWAFIGEASRLERICDGQLDTMPYGEARRIIREITRVSEFLRSKADAMPRVVKPSEHSIVDATAQE